MLTKKMAQANAEHALAEARKWQNDEPSKLAAVKNKAKIEIKNEAMTKVFEYGMSFRRSALHLIRKKHLGIDLFGINFLSMEGQNIPNLMMG